MTNFFYLGIIFVLLVLVSLLVLMPIVERFSFEIVEKPKVSEGLNMTDFERLKTLFDDFGVGYDCSTDNAGFLLNSRSDHKKNNSYTGFYVQFVFDKDGKFLELRSCE